MKISFFALSITGSLGTSNPIGFVATSGARVVEIYNETRYIRQYDDDVQSRLIEQRTIDEMNDQYTPNTLNTTHEFTPLGMITLGDRIAIGSDSVIFDIKEYPRLVIKYQSNCHDDEIHPMLREAWYGKEANEVGIGPKIEFLSPPVRMCESPQGKCIATLSAGSYHECRDTTGTLRYMIEEKFFGENLRAYRMRLFREGNMGLRNAAMIGIGIIEQLKVLHESAKIVHGDIYAPNVIVVPSNETAASLRLIDFGRASRILDTPLPTFPIEEGAWFHELCTQWQMDGYAWTRRDDIMKAVQTVVELMQPLTFQFYIQKLKAEGKDKLIEWKCKGRMYVTSSHDPVAVLKIPKSHKDQLYEHLDTLLDLVRSLDINGPIPYERLIVILAHIVQLIDGDALSAFATAP